MSNGDDPGSGYDPRLDPDSPDFDPDLYDDFHPEPEPEPEPERVCEAVECEIVEVEKDRCMEVCRVECNDGTVLTTFEEVDCPESSS